MVTTKPGSPGRARSNRRAIAQGRPDCLRRTCMLMCTKACVFWHMRPRVRRAPGLPCALFVRGANEMTRLGQKLSRERELTSRRPRLVRNCARGAGTHTPCVIVVLQRWGECLQQQSKLGVMGPRVRGDDERFVARMSEAICGLRDHTSECTMSRGASGAFRPNTAVDFPVSAASTSATMCSSRSSLASFFSKSRPKITLSVAELER